MAIVVADIKTEIAEELLEYGDYSTDSGSYLERMLFKAAKTIDRMNFPWQHQISSTTLTTTSESKGPYDAPADFKKFVTEERLSRAYEYDKHSLPVIPDGDYNKIYEVYWQRGEAKIYFWLDPGDATYTFYYVTKLDEVADIASWEQELIEPLKTLTKSFCLVNSQDTKKDAREFKGDFEQEVRQVMDDLRRGMSLQETRDPRDIYGDSYYSEWDRWVV